jgi:hypothetical protein
MKHILNLTILSSVVLSLNCFATVRELNFITLTSDEVISPARDIDSVTADSIQLFDGRIIKNFEIKNIEVNDSNGSSKIIPSGHFKLISVDGAKVSGGDATGGG